MRQKIAKESQYIVNNNGHCAGGLNAIDGLKDLYCTKSGHFGDVGIGGAAGPLTLKMSTLKDTLKNTQYRTHTF
jgi:hypothetical protein